MQLRLNAPNIMMGNRDEMCTAVELDTTSDYASLWPNCGKINAVAIPAVMKGCEIAAIFSLHDAYQPLTNTYKALLFRFETFDLVIQLTSRSNGLSFLIGAVDDNNCYTDLSRQNECLYWHLNPSTNHFVGEKVCEIRMDARQDGRFTTGLKIVFEYGSVYVKSSLVYRVEE